MKFLNVRAGLTSAAVFAYALHSAVSLAGTLEQNAEALESTNGRIVFQENLTSRPECGSSAECYKIRYLSDGLEVVAFIVVPGERPEKLPVLIFNRGGNREFGKLKISALRYLSYFAANGYVVLASQYRGNDGGEGMEEFGGSDVNDILNLMPMAKALPFADADRAVMLGFSRGGMMTMVSIRRGANIRAAAIVGAWSDLETAAQERGEKLERVFEELIGFDRREWKKRSAIYWASDINVPLLILHGADDWRANVGHSKRLAEKLGEAGKKHKLVIFEGGDHGLKTHREERNSLILNWFSEHLN